MIDCHTHSLHSHDGSVSAEDMLRRAIELGAKYYAITDHSDLDYHYILPQYPPMKQLDTLNHIEEIKRLQLKYRDEVYLALGIELSYAKQAEQDYITQLAMTDNWDIVVNSLHTVNGHDIYFPSFYDGKDKRTSYSEYLEALGDSLNAAYSFDTVAHLGYCTRKAPYQNFFMRYSEFPDILDSILIKIIARDATLEINTHCREDLCLPHIDILSRYRELGGDNITFGSDAHQLARVLDKYDAVAEKAKHLGFRYYTIYKQRIARRVLI